MNKKKIKKIVIFSIAILIIALLLSFCLNIGGFVAYIPATTINDLSEYQDGAYTEYEGGKNAAQYLPTYDSLQDAEEVFFHYHSNKSRRFFIPSLPDVFAVDVKYSEDVFEQKKYEVFAAYTEGDEETIRQKYKEHTSKHFYDDGDYSLYERFLFLEDSEKYVDIITISYNDSASIIRYCFIYRLLNDDVESTYHRKLYIWCELYSIKYTYKENTSETS